MIARWSFLVVAGFWVTMNVLLWRAEYGVREGGSPIPVETVVRRILTAPDDSSLEILRGGERIGYCHWVAGAVEELTLETPPEMEGLPEGMVQRPTAYGIRVDGGILAGDRSNRLRFALDLELTAEREWRRFTVRLGQRPSIWEVRAVAEERTVELRWGTEASPWVHQLSLDDLGDPVRLLEELGGPWGLGLAPWLNLAGGGQELELGLQWEGRTDWMQLGGTRVRVYRLTARLGGRYRIEILVSRVGEILRVDLPEGIALVNDVLVNL